MPATYFVLKLRVPRLMLQLLAFDHHPVFNATAISLPALVFPHHKHYTLLHLYWWADVTGLSLSVSPRLYHQQRPHQNQDPYGHLCGGQFLGSPNHHHSGLDLPPLAAIGGDRDRNVYGPYNPLVASHLPAAPSSYISSGSNALSRMHSPLNQAGLGTRTSLSNSRSGFKPL